ncbi:MAG: helix-turn-helix transcriptional regulator [Boseongicola sp.]|nr:helix-turn-helix transcriptional regulator [Boseongicola sp.]
MEDSTEADRAAIKAAIAEECEAFYLRDYDRWASCWVHDEDVQRLATDAGGNIGSVEGWATGSGMIKRLMKEHPTPNPVAVEKIRREFKVIRINGSMAWVSFNQMTPRTDDVRVNVGLSYQIRVMEKHDGQWKVLFAGHADTRMEYFLCPAMSVETDGTMIWMNDQAREALREHPVLALSAGHLRARRPNDHQKLMEAIERIEALSVMDIRLSPMNATRAQEAIALVFDDPLDDAVHVIWVDRVDGATTVTFADTATTEQRLEAAADVFALSQAQLKVGRMIVDGKDLPEAASELGVSVNTVRTHLQRMFEKAHVNSQTALVRVLLSSGAPNV